MAVTTDTLVTEFKMVGAPQLLKALNSITDAYKKMAAAQAKVASIPIPKVPGAGAGGSGGSGGASGGWAGFFAGMIGGGRLGGAGIKGFAAEVVGGTVALEGLAASAASVLGPIALVVGSLTAVSAATKKAEDSLIEYGKAIMDIRDLSGESAQESAKAHAVFMAAGISDVTAMREFLKVGRDIRSQSGETGFGLLGVRINQSDSPLQAILKISKALHDMPGGMQKVEAAAEALGIRNTSALLSLSRLTDAQKSMAEAGAFNVSDDDLASIQDLGVQFNLIGQEIMTGLVYPLAKELLPYVKEVTDTLLNSKDIILEIADAISTAGKLIYYVLVVPFENILKTLKSISDLWYFVFGGSAKDLSGSDASTASTGTGDLKGSIGNLQSSIDRNSDIQQTTNMHLAKLASNNGIPGGLSNWDLNTISSQNMLGALS